MNSIRERMKYYYRNYLEYEHVLSPSNQYVNDDDQVQQCPVLLWPRRKKNVSCKLALGYNHGLLSLPLLHFPYRRNKQNQNHEICLFSCQLRFEHL